MSRIGKQPITVPGGVEVTIDGPTVTREGPEGQARARPRRRHRRSRSDGDKLNVERPDDERARTARCTGCSRTLVANMVEGVSDGFAKELEIVGVGYRAAAQGPNAHRAAGRLLAHRCKFDAPEGVTFEVPAPTRITCAGIDKQLVGQVAADIRKVRKPEPYKGKGIRYDGERVRRKAGKSAK